ncbi:MAG: hypothetical protein PHU78_04650, partial [Heliobacteriaceae bacterium]|nr:hypothetical protein [Heliobacteriaceae bacterium]
MDWQQVSLALVDVWDRPELPLERVTQAWLGSRVVIGAESAGWCRVSLPDQDGYQGWLKKE